VCAKKPKVFFVLLKYMTTPEEPIDLTEDEEDQMEDEDEEFISVEALLGSTLMTEEGDTVCSALVNIARQLEMQNKIMVKILTTLQKKA